MWRSRLCATHSRFHVRHSGFRMRHGGFRARHSRLRLRTELACVGQARFELRPNRFHWRHSEARMRRSGLRERHDRFGVRCRRFGVPHGRFARDRADSVFAPVGSSRDTRFFVAGFAAVRMPDMLAEETRGARPASRSTPEGRFQRVARIRVRTSLSFKTTISTPRAIGKTCRAAEAGIGPPRRHTVLWVRILSRNSRSPHS